ncbi:hypothetical protein BC936DRAFT_145978 [Jimgerdemannia flammicorona]|uniref:FAD dependent oxidoreductase domain-containing protein n=1 Tax=Jimgerdemannia flammicorona TaxID=994334 RepID=A0A433D8N1_9FUNG|nr:hypothetical protein BC936DRAFT_145978 [Jimgerdemannia flammicorona]
MVYKSLQLLFDDLQGRRALEKLRRQERRQTAGYMIRTASDLTSCDCSSRSCRYTDPNRPPERLWNDGQSNSAETGVWIIDAFDYWDKVPEVFEEPWFKVLTPGYRHLSKQELPANTEFGITYQTISINSSKYLAYLLRSFTALGGTVDRRLVQHIGDVMLPGVDIVANCTGLSARTLGGVEDSSVFPARGQIVIIKAPHVDFTFERYSGGNGLGSGGTISYVIPRDNGEVILGGTYFTTSSLVIQPTWRVDLDRNRALHIRKATPRSTRPRYPTSSSAALRRAQTFSRTSKVSRFSATASASGHAEKGVSGWRRSGESLRMAQPSSYVITTGTAALRFLPREQSLRADLASSYYHQNLSRSEGAAKRESHPESSYPLCGVRSEDDHVIW